MPLYGSTLWVLSKKCVNRFYVTWWKIMRLLLILPYIICYPVLLKINQWNCYLQRFAKFCTNMHQSRNVLLKFCSKLASSGSCSYLMRLIYCNLKDTLSINCYLQRFAKFCTNMHQSRNVLLKFCSKLASSGSCSSVSNNYVFIKQKYDVNDDFSNANEKINDSDS